MDKEKMTLSLIKLDDSESYWADEGERSIAYFCKRTPVGVDQKLLSELKKVASLHKGKSIRLCLHDSPTAPFHDMLIVKHRGKYYRPHKHLVKSETFHIIEGAIAYFVFDEDGGIVDNCILEKGGALLYRIGENINHTDIPLSDVVIVHESKPGPFTGRQELVFPTWAPEESDSAGIESFTGKLLRLIKSQ